MLYSIQEDFGTTSDSVKISAFKMGRMLTIFQFGGLWSYIPDSYLFRFCWTNSDLKQAQILDQ